MEYKDYYKILGLEKAASVDEIKKAYRRLARKYHPDVSKEANAEEQFKNVKEAYEVLKDPEKRKMYDQLGSNWRAGQEFRDPKGWGGRQQAESQGRTYSSQGFEGFTESDMSGFSDFFTHLFGQGQTRGQAHKSHFQGFQQRGGDQQVKVTISLEDAFRGASQTLNLQVPAVDTDTGQVHYKMRTLKISIPAGAYENQQLRLTGQGEPGINGGSPGDLYLEIHISQHRFFSIQGRDLYLTLPITPWEAALGAEIKVPTLAGPVGLKLKAGSQAGQKLRLKGRGMPGKPEAGDQFAIIQINTPPAQTETERQLYQRMAEIMPFNPRKDWMI